MLVDVLDPHLKTKREYLFLTSIFTLATLPPVLFTFKFPVHGGPNDFLGYTLISLCLLSLMNEKYIHFLFYALLGCFCRETNLIVLAPFILMFNVPLVKRIAISSIIGIIFILYRLGWEGSYNPSEAAAHNYTYPIESFLFLFMVFAYFWLLGILGYIRVQRSVPFENHLARALNRSFWMVSISVISIVWAFARVREIRIEYILFIYFIPYGIVYCLRKVEVWSSLLKPYIIILIILITTVLTFSVSVALTPESYNHDVQLGRTLAHFYGGFGGGWKTVFLSYLAITLVVFCIVVLPLTERKTNITKQTRNAQARQNVGKDSKTGWIDSILKNPFPALLFLEGVSVLLYINIFHAPFVFDDVTIRDNARIHVDSLSELFGILFDSTHDRRIGYFTFALNFYVGGLDTYGYHLVNHLLHLISGGLVFWLVSTTLKLPRLCRSATRKQAGLSGELMGTENQADKIAFFTALIWLVHPVQIQTVTYIVQRLAGLSALLFLTAFAFYLKGRLSLDRERYLFFGLSALAGLISLGVKQNVAVLPFFIVLYDLYFFSEAPWEALKKRIKWVFLLGVFLILVTLFYLGPSFWATLQERFAQREFTMGQRLLSEARVVLYYLSLIALPLPSRLNVDYDFPVSISLFDPVTTLPSVGVVLVGIGYAFKVAGKRPLLSFAILWYFGNLAIESTIIPLDLVFEHRLYLPSLAPIAVVTAFVSQKFSGRKEAGVLLLATIAVIFGFWTFQRNEVWTDPVRLWSDNVQKSPNKARVHGNLGKALLDAGQYKAAAAAFENALQRDPNLIGAYNNLATIYIDHLKQYDRAKTYLYAALERFPDYPDAYLNLGVIALNQGQHDRSQFPAAVQAFEKVLELDPKNLMAHRNLAACYMNLQEFSEAFLVLDRGLSFWPAGYGLYLLKGRAYLMLKDLPAARQAFARAYALRPDDPEVRHWYAQVR